VSHSWRHQCLTGQLLAHSGYSAIAAEDATAVLLLLLLLLLSLTHAHRAEQDATEALKINEVSQTRGRLWITEAASHHV